jgi:hypothetical protein
LRGQLNVTKAHTLRCAAYNLGVLLRKIWGYCKPRNAKAGAAALFWVFLPLLVAAMPVVCLKVYPLKGRLLVCYWLILAVIMTAAWIRSNLECRQNRHLLTGC